MLNVDVLHDPMNVGRDGVYQRGRRVQAERGQDHRLHLRSILRQECILEFYNGPFF